MSFRQFSSGSSSKAVATPIPPPLPPPRTPARFTSSLPCDELSALVHEKGEEGGARIPESVLSTPRMVRDAVYSYVHPQDQSKDAYLLSWNKEFAKTLGVDKNKLERSQWSEEEYDHLVKVLTGGARTLSAADYKNTSDGPRLAQPWALCYGGHQFGYYAGQLGDGRAISLYETVNKETGESWELQLKGAGKTPYSRFADGYAVLRSSIREYLCAEFVAALDVPSSRSLAILSTKTQVIREEGVEPGSIVCRVAPSWVRFGNFEIFFYRKDRKNLRKLAEYVTEQVFNLPKDNPEEMTTFAMKNRKNDINMTTTAPEPVITKESATTATEGAAEGAPAAESSPKPAYRNRFAKMFEQIAHRTAIMVSGWQAVGFCHGVMNTDNMSVLGLTIDYGPYAFLDKYDPAWICNHSDTEGRYAFQQQPGICLWNLGRLALTLENLIGAQERVDELEWLELQESDPEKEQHLKEAAQNIIVDILNKNFREVFLKDYRRRMNAKLGLGGPEQVRDEDLTKILVPALSWMDDYEIDFHQFFRDLADYKVQKAETLEENMDQVKQLVKRLLPPVVWQTRGSAAVEESRSWLAAYHTRIVESDELRDDQKRRSKMNKINPAFVLRNWVAQKVIERTTESVRKTREGSQEDDPDKDLLDRVLWMCQHPFGEETKEPTETMDIDACEVKRNNTGLEVYGEFVGPVPEWGQGIQCSCSS
ncbi:hypothetical protein BX616_009653 [Lobosporangium transversale]|uniref:Selenoprotein O n=1 Tax=Lobosporangium transversale TaxID=64571 RepID=A0A1Y2GLG0_9FUNG|nr:hypothetical protein BCR41DRAFT_371689 [Lobosporangium transversale]KAF9913747.1 hypothetical protein BX616_009653 [Lobosporangium transversale]ORZ12993.1 hypothetical protein BCR41DRAFT_371689 [Lobosporangium transversale]|eukprot:XP_021880342.1 hypothetical protein BCR41DRAFT_371689 [Lobosporangium transversale]